MSELKMTPPKFPEVFSEADVQDAYNKIMKEGYKSRGAGDMWEPSYPHRKKF